MATFPWTFAQPFVGRVIDDNSLVSEHFYNTFTTTPINSGVLDGLLSQAYFEGLSSQEFGLGSVEGVLTEIFFEGLSSETTAIGLEDATVSSVFYRSETTNELAYGFGQGVVSQAYLEGLTTNDLSAGSVDAVITSLPFVTLVTVDKNASVSAALVTSAYFVGLTGFFKIPDLLTPFRMVVHFSPKKTLINSIYHNIIMSSNKLSFKRGDTADPLELTLEDSTGAVDLTNADSVLLYMKDSKGVKKIDGAAMTVVVAADGTVKRDWASDDVDTAGVFRIEVVVLWSGGKTTTFPSRDAVTVTIQERIRE